MKLVFLSLMALCSTSYADVWNQCAGENGTCVVSGAGYVKYGTDTRWIIKAVSSASVACGNQVFSDPAPGIVKACFTMTKTPTWTTCSAENGTCALTGPQAVRYGANNNWILQMKGAGTFSCDNGTFTDPLVGTVKGCQVLGDSTLTNTPPVNPTAVTGQWQILNYAGLSYRLLLPDNYDPKYAYPVVTFLHGQAGDVGPTVTDPQMAGYFNNTTFRSKYPAIVIAPQCAGSADLYTCNWGGLQTTEWPAENSAMQITQLIMSQYSVDVHRIYITGLSMGGIGTWDAIWRYNSLYAAALPIAGMTYAQGTATIPALLSTPIWATHGSADPTVPVSYDEADYADNKNLGGQLMNYTEYAGYGHDVWDVTYSDETYVKWLFSQRR